MHSLYPTAAIYGTQVVAGMCCHTYFIYFSQVSFEGASFLSELRLLVAATTCTIQPVSVMHLGEHLTLRMKVRGVDDIGRCAPNQN